MFSFIFNTFFYKPLLNVLALFVWLIPGGNFGLAIILLTLFVNFILLPFTHRMKKSQKKMQELEPELKRIKLQYKDQKEEQARQTLELYRKHGINPFSGFLLLFIQIPLFIALYKVFAGGATFHSTELYNFIPTISQPHALFVGFDLAAPNVFLTAIAALFQFVQGHFLMPKNTDQKANEMARVMSIQFRYVLPIVIFLIGLKLPSALALYWTTMSIFGIVHEGVVRKKAKALASDHGRENNSTTNSGT